MNNAIYTQNQESRKSGYAQFIANQMLENYKFPLLLILLHLPLGVFLYNIGSLGLIHPIAAFAIGMRHALIVEEKLERAAQVAAYLVGAEILWRMAGVPILWEFGKYGAAFIMITALVRRRLWKMPAFAVFYFILLLPACFITLLEKSLSSSKDTISFNLSGPFLLLISSWFFSYMKVNWLQIRKVLLALIIPLMSAAVATLFYTVTATEIEFNGESNFATSGGFGPNQVSAMLGLGAFLCIACLLLFKNSFKYTLFYGVAGIIFISQSVLTFSRGGIYNAIGGVLLIIVFQMRDLKAGISRLLPVIGIAVLFLAVIFPYLNNFTGGALEERFEDKETTGRAEIVEADFQIFAQNPFLGIGLGNAYTARQAFLNDKKAISHTEFSRLIAEHGSFGLLAIFAIILMIVFNLKKQESILGRSLVVGLIAWSVLFMFNAGMRLAAPSLILGMIYLILIHSEPQKSALPEAEN